MGTLSEQWKVLGPVGIGTVVLDIQCLGPRLSSFADTMSHHVLLYGRVMTC